MKSRKILLGITGGIAAYKTPDLVRRLKDTGVDVTVVMTPEAEHFVTALTLQTVSGNKVYKDMFEVQDVWDVEHVGLAESADLVLIAPATANTIAKLAAGLCDDLLTCVVAATAAPVVLAPAMNDRMYLNKINQENVARLKKIGYKFIGPDKGPLACGKISIGRMCDIDLLVRTVLGYLK
jgi:phosphopantothenoylcysteine decarboxylase/phosphopantothenate--cysteine ligase